MSIATKIRPTGDHAVFLIGLDHDQTRYHRAGYIADNPITLIDALIGVAPEARAICGVEGGNWVLARAGLLNGETATTRIEDLEEFADVFPEIGVVADRFTISGRYATTSGPAPVIEYMLHLIRGRFGPELADNVAQAINYQTAPAARRPAVPTPTAAFGSAAPARRRPG